MLTVPQQIQLKALKRKKIEVCFQFLAYKIFYSR